MMWDLFTSLPHVSSVICNLRLIWSCCAMGKTCCVHVNQALDQSRIRWIFGFEPLIIQSTQESSQIIYHICNAYEQKYQCESADRITGCTDVCLWCKNSLQLLFAATRRLKFISAVRSFAQLLFPQMWIGGKIRGAELFLVIFFAVNVVKFMVQLECSARVPDISTNWQEPTRRQRKMLELQLMAVRQWRELRNRT